MTRSDASRNARIRAIGWGVACVAAAVAAAFLVSRTDDAPRDDARSAPKEPAAEPAVAAPRPAPQADVPEPAAPQPGDTPAADADAPADAAPGATARLAEARSAFRAATDTDARIRGVAAIAASGADAALGELVDVVRSDGDAAVREAAVLALATPAASAVLPELRALLKRESDPVLALALRVAVAKIEARPIRDAGAFEIAATFDGVPETPGTVRVRATVRRRDAGGPVTLRVDWSSEGKDSAVANRWAGPLAVGDAKSVEIDVPLPAEAPAQVFEVTATSKGPAGHVAATRRYDVHLDEGRVVWTAQDPAARPAPPPTEEVR